MGLWPARPSMHVAVLVPWRDAPRQDRKAHLDQFLAEVPAVLGAAAASASASVTVLVGRAPQDGRPFARGRTLNALAHLATTWSAPTRLVLHDVDLLPDADRAAGYFAPFSRQPGARALARGPGDEYVGCANYIGGVLALEAAAFWAVDGFPNQMEGWGGEDDALFDRLVRAGVHLDVWTAGRLRNLELEGVVGRVRARDDPAACAPKATRRALRARWRDRDPALSGAAGLYFTAAVARQAEVPATGVTVVVYDLLECPAAPPPPGWVQRLSASKHVPYLVNPRTGASRWRGGAAPPPHPISSLTMAWEEPETTTGTAGSEAPAPAPVPVPVPCPPPPPSPSSQDGG